MIFNSIDFAVFLPIVFLLYWVIPNQKNQLRNLLILVSSYIFYGWWDWRFLSLIIISTTLDFFVGIALQKKERHIHRKLLLWLSIGVNVGMLGFFKYFNFFLESFIEAFSFFGMSIQGPSLNIVLPVGISFYTFQTLSYTIDIYNRKFQPTKDLIAFGAFVSFFTQLVAGPIERASHLLPQFQKPRLFNYEKFTKGLNQILFGLIKKIVIADRLAIVVNEVYNHPHEYHGFTLILATVLFAFQIYCDFSGYSDIAVGTAKLFGFDLMKNFNYPYFSTSLTEFWRRWHISLSTWFRDYVYIPLGGNKTNKTRWSLNIFTVFLISGLWHGANWTFVVWGSIHGVLLIIESRYKLNSPSTRNINNFLRGLFTFSFVCFGWVFFRANSIQDALYIIQNLLSFQKYSLDQLSFYVVPTSKNSVFAIDIFLSLVLISSLLIIEYFLNRKFDYYKIPFHYRLPIYVLGIWSIYVLGSFEKNDFIYFQF